MESFRGKLSDIVLQNVQNDIMKAVQTVATNTFSPQDRSVFTPENLDEKIKLLVPINVPLRNRFPRMPGFGQTANWKAMTSKLNAKLVGGQTGTDTSIAFADGTAPGETTQTYEVRYASFKLLGRKLDIGGMAIASSKGVQGGGYADMMEAQLPIKINELKLGEEELILMGDTDVTNEFDGLLKLTTTISGTTPLLTVSGLQSQVGSIFDAGGQPTALVCHRFQSGAIANQLQGTGSINRIQFDNQGRAIGGLRVGQVVSDIDGTLIDIVVSRYIGSNALLLTERMPSGENVIEMHDLIPISRIDVPSAVFSTTTFVLEATVLIVKAEEFQAKFSGLATS